jgi:hypothetical protein
MKIKIAFALLIVALICLPGCFTTKKYYNTPDPEEPAPKTSGQQPAR